MKNIFYPLAEIAAEANSEFDQVFDAMHPNVYAQVKKYRDKSLAKSHKAKVPEFYENQIVFAIDQAPAVQGVSSILKLPTKGPFRISKIEERNVSLIELETGKEYSSHVGLIRPLSLSEFKVILAKDWDLNVQISKAPRAGITRSSLNNPNASLTEEEVKDEEKLLEKYEAESLDLENLFEENYSDTDTLENPDLRAEKELPDIQAGVDKKSHSDEDESGGENTGPKNMGQKGPIGTTQVDKKSHLDQEDENLPELSNSEGIEFNSIGIEEDLSPEYKKSILKKGLNMPKVRFGGSLIRFFPSEILGSSNEDLDPR
jgi:hypothetical protein